MVLWEKLMNETTGGRQRICVPDNYQKLVLITLLFFPTPLSLVFFTLIFLHIVYLFTSPCTVIVANMQRTKFCPKYITLTFDSSFSLLIKIPQFLPCLILLFLCILLFLFFSPSGTICQTWQDPPMWPLELTSKIFPRWKITLSSLYRLYVKH